MGKNYSEFRTGRDRNSNFNSALVESLLELEQLRMSHLLRTEQVKAISTLASGEDFLAVLKRVGRPTQLLSHTKMLLDPNIRFSSGG